MRSQSHFSIAARSLVVMAIVGCGTLTACWLIYDWSYVEKMLTRCAMPVGAMWLILLSMTIVAFARRRGLLLTKSPARQTRRRPKGDAVSTLVVGF